MSGKPIIEWPDDQSDPTPPPPPPLSASSTSSSSYASSSSSVGDLPSAILFEIGQAVEATAMTKLKSSRDKQFQFVRRVKAIARCHQIELEPPQHAAIYRLWQSRNEAFLSPGVDYFSEYLSRFSVARFASGEKLELAFQRALIATPTNRVSVFHDKAAHVLANLCRELQIIAGPEPFFLACRSAATLLGVHFTTVADWLRGFQTLGILELIEKGKRQPGKVGKASRYRYIA